MIPRHEFYTALSLAIAAASLPHDSGPVLDGAPKANLGNICFDFWPSSMRIVGTNGQRLAVSYLNPPPGVPEYGKFLMPLDKACEAMYVFMPSMIPEVPDPEPLTLLLYGLDQMVITSGEQAMVVDGDKSIYPEYHIMLDGDQLPARGVRISMDALTWAIGLAGQLGASETAVNIRAHSPATVRPMLPAGYQYLRDVVLAVKPLGVAT